MNYPDRETVKMAWGIFLQKKADFDTTHCIDFVVSVPFYLNESFMMQINVIVDDAYEKRLQARLISHINNYTKTQQVYLLDDLMKMYEMNEGSYCQQMKLM